MAEHKKKTEEKPALDLSMWEQSKAQNNREIDAIASEEATILGQMEQLTIRLNEIQKIREGLRYSNVTGDRVCEQAMKSFNELSNPEEK